jgi:membrane-associated phospholipid phosphatase
METSISQKTKADSLFSEIFNFLLPVLKSRYFYIGLITLIAGLGLNIVSQIYLNNLLVRGTVFPSLSDMVLDQLPVIDASLVYDMVCIAVFFIVMVYIIHRKDYGRIPYFLLLTGLFYVVRGIFVALTPLGNPPNFEGSNPHFNGFCLYELGVYPSGHVGNSFLLLLLVNDKTYRYLIGLCLVLIILALFYSHCHYSIDIFSGFLFAYAIKAYGDKHMNMFVLKEKDPGN